MLLKEICNLKQWCLSHNQANPDSGRCLHKLFIAALCSIVAFISQSVCMSAQSQPILYDTLLQAESAETTTSVQVSAAANRWLSDIIFVGNKFFATKELSDYILSKATRLSIPNKILSTYYNESTKNKYFPTVYTEQFYTALARYNNEYHFVNKEIAENDVNSLIDLYNINGFHDVEITYSIGLDSNSKQHLLTFYINENTQYHLATGITYNGLEELAPDVKRRFDTLVKLKAGDNFNEEKIEYEVKIIQSLLLRTGYMYSKWTAIDVITDSVNAKDSVVAYFELGNRIKIGKIIFADSARGQQVFANSTKRKLMRFAENTYYSRPRMERSIDNLLGTGVFESVRIDTVEQDYSDNDSTRDFVVTSIYRVLRDWDANMSFYETTIDRLWNFGVSGNLLHRNLFGSAQATSLYGGIVLKDANYFLSNFTFPDIEFKVGFSYRQPILWLIDNYRVALSSNLEYSWEILSGLFHISKVYIPIEFPISLPRTSYFSRLNVEFEISREVPTNYDEVVNHALDSARTLQDSNNVNSSLILYDKINNYINKPGAHVFTSNLLSLYLVGDDRDNLFNTTSGSMTLLSVDGFNPLFFPDILSGGSKYFRLNATHVRFWPLSKVSTIGIKGKVGWTYLFDEETSFVPQQRQFFAGGTNSVRAWPARELRYSLAEPAGSIAEFAKSYIGSRTLIEGSIEYRRKLSDIPGISESIAWIVRDLSVGVFLDFGNTFGWYIEDSTNKADLDLNITDYVTKLAVGVGIGLRYELPIGPIRFDFATPLHDPDPMRPRPAFWDLTFVFGIGHAF